MSSPYPVLSLAVLERHQDGTVSELALASQPLASGVSNEDPSQQRRHSVKEIDLAMLSKLSLTCNTNTTAKSTESHEAYHRQVGRLRESLRISFSLGSYKDEEYQRRHALAPLTEDSNPEYFRPSGHTGAWAKCSTSLHSSGGFSLLRS